jgi:hypothetical protein
LKVDDDLLLIKYLYRIESVDRNHNNIQTLSIYKTKHGNWTIRMTIFFICIWAKFSFVWNISALFEYFPNYILMLLAASKFKTSLPLMLKRSSVDQYMSTRTTMMFCSSVVITIRSFPHYLLITGFVKGVTGRMLHMEQELPNLPEHLRSPRMLVGFALLDLQFSIYCFVDRCLSLCPFSFDHCFVYPSIYGFWLPLWYLQTFHMKHSIVWPV